MEEIKSHHYVGSWFEITPTGCQVIISQFNDQYPNVFVNYEPLIHAFHLATNDQDVVTQLRGILGAQIKLWQSGKTGDALDSYTMIPLKQTILETDHNSPPGPAQSGMLELNLIDFNEDSEDSSDESTLSEDTSIHWTPKCGNIAILQHGLANAIANQTGCIFCPEPERKRVRLMSGNTQVALEKLQRLEPLLVELGRHGSTSLPKVDNNILCLSSEAKGTGVRYVPIMEERHGKRILIPGTIKENLVKILIGEEQVYNATTGKYDNVQSLLAISTKETIHDPALASNIWSGYQIEGFGDPENAQVKDLSSAASVISPLDTLKPNENMGTLEQIRVREWSKNIDIAADPTQAVSSPTVSEPGVEELLSVRVVARSESDDEDIEPQEVTRRMVAQDSDDEMPIPTRTQGIRESQIYHQQTPSYTQHEKPVPNTRADRANRREGGTSNFQGNYFRVAAPNVVSADAFFADVPRDDNAQGETKFRDTSPSARRALRTSPDVDQRASQARELRNPGFDGNMSEVVEQHSSEQVWNAPISPVSTSALASNSNLPEQETQYAPGPRFDPTRYGADRRTSQKDAGRRYATSQNVFSSDQSQSSPVATFPQASAFANATPEYRRRLANTSQSQRAVDHLINRHNDEDERHANMRPPPGLSPPRTHDVVQSSNILDAPLNEIQKPSLKSAWDDTPFPSNDEFSTSGSTSSGARRMMYDCHIQTKINKPNIGFIRNDAINQLMAARNSKKSNNELPKPAAHLPEQIDVDDEASLRKFRNTMNLKAPNPGRGKKGKSASFNPRKNETTAQKNERIAKAKAELGILPVRSRPSEPRGQQLASEQLSSRGQKAARANPEMARLHAETLQNTSRRMIAGQIREQFQNAFEVTRLFPGDVELEVQIGQLLILPGSRIRDSRTVYEPDRWRPIFQDGPGSADVLFTNVLTSGGSDVDGILAAKVDGQKVWNEDSPGLCTFMLDLQCQHSSGAEFILHYDLKGSHSMSRDELVIHRVGLHCPGRVWDACVVLKGVPVWHDAPDGLDKSIKELINSMYLKAGEKVDISFRTPSDNSLTVQKVVVRKTSKHSSHLPGEEDLQLKIVETKTLYMKSHRKDQRLMACYEGEHFKMAEEDQVHFEVSIIDVAINASFEQNRDLEVGEMTSSDPSTARLFTTNRANCIVNAGLRLVDKVDWVGAYNFGTIAKYGHEQSSKQQAIARSMPPSAYQPLRLAMGTTIAGPRSVVGSRTVAGSTVGENSPMSVSGIRSGTRPLPYTDGRGNFFRIGLGGARIPIDIQEEESAVADNLAPDDSASQVGGVRRTLPRAGERPDSFW